MSGGDEKMNILQKVSSRELSVNDAFSKLYGPKTRKIRFIFLRIHLSDSKALSLLLNLLFLLPLPLFLVKPIVIMIIKKTEYDYLLISELLNTGGGMKVKVITKEEKIYLKLF